MEWFKALLNTNGSLQNNLIETVLVIQPTQNGTPGLAEIFDDYFTNGKVRSCARTKIVNADVSEKLQLACIGYHVRILIYRDLNSDERISYQLICVLIKVLFDLTLVVILL